MDDISFASFRNRVASIAKQASDGLVDADALAMSSADRADSTWNTSVNPYLPKKVGTTHDSTRLLELHKRVPAHRQYHPPPETTNKPRAWKQPSKRIMMLAGATRKISIRLYPNDAKYSGPGQKILLPESMEMLLDIATQKLNLNKAARYLFTKDGEEIQSLDAIQEEMAILVSCKESLELAKKEREGKPTRLPGNFVPVGRDSRDFRNEGPPIPWPSPGQIKQTEADGILSRYRLAYGGSFMQIGLSEIPAPKRLKDLRFHCGLGTLSLRNLGITSLEGLETQTDMVEMYIQNNFLINFEHLGVQPKLKEMRFENNYITNFKGFQYQPKLEAIYLQGNPVFEHPHYRLMCYILQVCNPGIKIDDEGTQRSERNIALLLAPKVSHALREGWLLETRPSPSAEYDLTIDEYLKFRAAQIAMNSPDSKVKLFDERKMNGNEEHDDYEEDGEDRGATDDDDDDDNEIMREQYHERKDDHPEHDDGDYNTNHEDNDDDIDDNEQQQYQQQQQLPHYQQQQQRYPRARVRRIKGKRNHGDSEDDTVKRSIQRTPSPSSLPASALQTPATDTAKLQNQVLKLTNELQRTSEKTSAKERALAEAADRIAVLERDLSRKENHIVQLQDALTDAERIAHKRAEQCAELQRVIEELGHRREGEANSNSNSNSSHLLEKEKAFLGNIKEVLTLEFLQETPGLSSTSLRRLITDIDKHIRELG